jgi:hypothetical protein
MEISRPWCVVIETILGLDTVSGFLYDSIGVIGYRKEYLEGSMESMPAILEMISCSCSVESEFWRIAITNSAID